MMKRKELKSGNFTLVHHILPGVFGQPENFFELVEMMSDGTKVLRPFWPPLKVRNLTLKSSIFYLDTYTNREYKKMLSEQIKLLNEKVSPKA
jgi:hypothetical protein